MKRLTCTRNFKKSFSSEKHKTKYFEHLMKKVMIIPYFFIILNK